MILSKPSTKKKCREQRANITWVWTISEQTVFSLLFAITLNTSFSQATDSTNTKPKISISGYLDSYYLYAFNDPKSGTLMGSPGINGGYPAGRAFDRVTNQFSLGLVQTKLKYEGKKSEMVIDLTFGPNAELGNFGNTPTHVNGTTNLWTPGNGYVSQLYGTSAAIKQAYFTYKATDKLSFTAGQFGTHVGYEVIDAPLNFNYSLSNLFNNGPFYHIGVKANYVISEKLTAMIGIVNNWDNLFDNNKQKSLSAQLYWMPLNGFNIYLNYIGGYGDDTYLSTIAATSGQFYFEQYTRHLFDLTAGYQVTENFYLGLNAAYGFYNFKVSSSDESSVISSYGSLSPNWGGIALYSNYRLGKFISLGARYEYFDDNHYVRYLGSVNSSLTITAPITLADGHFIVKPELRVDTSKDNYYENRNGNGVNGQQTLGCAFIYKY